ncbi:MAG: helix-turn-helix domain-containing protein [Planctomycetota bacterium]
MKIQSNQPEDSVLKEMGARMTQRRLRMQWSQAELAERSGVSKRTVERIEGGASTQLANWIRVLRALELLEVLDGLLPESGPRPMDLLKLKQKQRKRASPGRKKSESAWDWDKEA